MTPFSPQAAEVDRRVMAGHWNPASLSAADELRAAEHAYWRSLDLSAPPLDDLQRHAEKFGLDGVKEAAALYGIKWSTDKATKIERKAGLFRQRRTTDELRRQVFDLHKRGLRPRPIADVLNVSDERVELILSGPVPEPA